MTATVCGFDWCGADHAGHVEHAWTDNVEGRSNADRTKKRHAYVWTSIMDIPGYDEPVMIGVEDREDDSYGGEVWLSLEEAERYRDALTAAIEHAGEGLQR